MIRSGYSFVAVEVKVWKYNKTLNFRFTGKPVSFVFPRVVLFPRKITLTSTLIISDITKTEYSNCCITHCFEENTWKGNVASHGTQFDIALENHALRAQHTDK